MNDFEVFFMEKLDAATNESALVSDSIKVKDPDVENGRLLEEMGIDQMHFPSECKVEMEFLRTAKGGHERRIHSIEPLHAVEFQPVKEAAPSKRSRKSHKEATTGNPPAPAS